VEELLNSIREYADHYEDEEKPTLANYMENVSLLTDADKDSEQNKDVVSLMTIHAAKGLEFGYVCIAGMEESLFPSYMSVSNPVELEEERRLFYVALTRAEKEVVLSYAMNRYKWGVPASCTPSRFINEINPKYLDFPKREKQVEQEQEEGYAPSSFNFNRRSSAITERKVHASIQPMIFQKSIKHSVIPDPDFIADDPVLIKEGMNISHQSFGKGKVLRIEGVIPNAKATVIFENGGEKKLLLKFARLKICYE
jgi:DNA helicase-2/ATP-dependent DNA helicase PcrA